MPRVLLCGTVCVVAAFLCLLPGMCVAQDGTIGTVTPKVATKFLIPSKEDIDKYTLGVRRVALGSTFGRDFAYNCTNGVFDWQNLGFATCASGKQQSPINIQPSFIAASRDPKTLLQAAEGMMTIDFQPQLFLLSDEYVLNLTVAPPSKYAQQPTKPSASATTPTAQNASTLLAPKKKQSSIGVPNLSSQISWQQPNGDKVTYSLKRIEFHVPAEHLINGVRFAGEIQFYLESSKPVQRLSISVLIQEAEIDHVSPSVSTLTAAMMGVEFGGASPLPNFNPVGLLPRLEGFWTYRGSLTSPPCTEEIQWVVMHHAVNVTKEFVSVVKERVNARYQGGNARPAIPKDMTFKIETFAQSREGGELMFTTPVELTPFRIALSQSAMGGVSWDPAEPSVVDIARAVMESGDYVNSVETQQTTSNSAFDPWQVLLTGRPRGGKGAGVPPPPLATHSVVVESLQQTIVFDKYEIIPQCDREYAWSHRYVAPDRIARCKADPNECGTPGTDTHHYPDIAPGSALLTPIANNNKIIQVTAAPLRGQVEQEIRPFANVLHIPPKPIDDDTQQ
eukprot:c4437_g1_i1.p1 GENE.c4437_g1_i1~~c4437_g1_i1.p1  ORF type:complete len:574 (+),score=161.63 c4437_g1_i1:36-1724(+)